MNKIELVGLDEVIYEDVCDNGLRVFMWVNKHVSSFYGTLSIKYGSIYNEYMIGKKRYKMPTGLAHYLEHLKFNESDDYTAHDFFKKNGCDTNAFTTFRYTNYQVLGSSNPKDNILHLLDFVENSYFTKKIVEDEKGIIIEEANMGKDDAYTVMTFKLFENLFHNSSYKDLIVGTNSDIKRISLSDIENVYNHFYHPKNMFLVITGNFNPYELMSSIKEHQNNKQFSKYLNPNRIISKESNKVVKKEDDVKLNVTNNKVKIGIKINKKKFKNIDELYLRIYMQLVLKANFGDTSSFKNDLIENEIISDLSYSYEIFDNYLIIVFEIDTDAKEEVVKLMNDKLNNLSIDNETFKRMKKASIASLILDYEDIEEVNSIIQSEILFYDKIIGNIKEVFESIKYEEVINFIKNLDMKEKSILKISPMKKE